MNITRRTFLSTAAVGGIALALPSLAIAKTVQYSPDTFDQYIADGRTFLMGVHAKWCSTCDRQKRVINALRAKGEPYDSLTMMAVDWDENRTNPLIGKLNVPRRSTLIMFKDGKEVGRVVAGTSTSAIQALIDKGF
ncbi:MAG: thioredoxin family protein [Rhizobiaceae bacterium]|nr:thioredoxin family protein [Rhizobiaceae bacterium]